MRVRLLCRPPPARLQPRYAPVARKRLSGSFQEPSNKSSCKWVQLSATMLFATHNLQFATRILATAVLTDYSAHMKTKLLWLAPALLTACAHVPPADNSAAVS